jgi:hypothetical protein
MVTQSKFINISVKNINNIKSSCNHIFLNFETLKNNKKFAKKFPTQSLAIWLGLTQPKLQTFEPHFLVWGYDSEISDSKQRLF